MWCVGEVASSNGVAIGLQYSCTGNTEGCTQEYQRTKNLTASSYELRFELHGASVEPNKWNRPRRILRGFSSGRRRSFTTGASSSGTDEEENEEDTGPTPWWVYLILVVGLLCCVGCCVWKAPICQGCRDKFQQGAHVEQEAPARTSVGASQPEPSVMSVVIPNGSGPGQKIRVTAVDGRQFDVTVPHDKAEGETMTVEVPTTIGDPMSV